MADNVNNDLDRALKQHLQPLWEELSQVKMALRRLEETVHTGDEGRGLISLTHRVKTLERRMGDTEEKDRWRRAWLAGFGVSLGVIAALAGLLGWQGLARLNKILEALGGG